MNLKPLWKFIDYQISVDGVTQHHCDYSLTTKSVVLTRRDRDTYIITLNKAMFVSDNGLARVQCQALILINIRLLLIGIFKIFCCEIVIKIQQFSYTKINLKMTSAIWRHFAYINIGSVIFWRSAFYMFPRQNKSTMTIVISCVKIVLDIVIKFVEYMCYIITISY